MAIAKKQNCVHYNEGDPDRKQQVTETFYKQNTIIGFTECRLYGNP